MENVNAIEEKKEEVSTTVQYIVVKIGNEQYEQQYSTLL